MANFISQTKYVNKLAESYNAKLSSQYTRMLQSVPTPVTYFHINNIESTTDSGFINIEKNLGKHSPLRFNEIKNFPLFNMPTIQLDLHDDERGIDIDFDGEAYILPNTIKPLPNDYFIVELLNEPCLFMVTELSYDTINSNSLYRISFTLKSISSDTLSNIQKQITDRFTCCLENIGTEDSWLISDDQTIILESLTGSKTGIGNGGIIGELLKNYKTAFYNDRFNTFIYESSYCQYIYDRYINHFIFTNELYFNKMSTDSLVLTCEDMDRVLDYEYEESIFHAIESKDLKLLKDEYKYRHIVITNPQSVFSFYDAYVLGVRYQFGDNEYITPTLIQSIKTKEPQEDIIFQTIIDYMNNEIRTLYQIDVDGLSTYNFKKYSMQNYILIPIMIYILRRYVKDLTTSDTSE